MAYSPVEQAYINSLVETQFPDPVEPEQEPMMLADSGQVKSDAQQGYGSIGPIPRNKAQEALGYVGELLTKAGVELDKYGIDIPKLGRITLKDLTVGEAGRVIEDMSYGFMPIEGAGGFISGTTRIKPDDAFELLNIAPVVGAAAKLGGKAVVKGATKAMEATKGMPVGMSIQEVGKGVDDLGFYSAASKAVDNIQQPKGTGEQFLKQIEKTPGVKPEELKWTGLDDFLKSKKTVTKQEVQDYLNANRVEIKEIQMGSGPNPYPYRTADEWQGAIDEAEKIGDFDESERLTNAWEAFEGFGVDDQTKFSKYTLPGGENYREVLLTLPAKEVPMPTGSVVKDGKNAEYPWAIMVDGKEVNRVDSLEFADQILQDEISRVAGKTSKQGEFKSQHFTQPNILAHLRVNDRVDVDGKKVLFVEEVQSDWHQAGRKKGYQDDGALAEIQKQREALLAEKQKYSELAMPYVSQGQDAPQDIIDGYVKADDSLNALQTKQNRLGSAVPDAPFKGNWHELAMKRAIQMASEGGYDRIAFTTGKTQAARYDLSKQIDNIQYKPMPDGKYYVSAIDVSGNAHLGNRYTLDEVEEYLGKDVAKKIADGNGDKLQGVPEDSPMRELSGVDLEVGGDGMKGFYDNILPKFLNNYAKKWDAKTGMTKIQTESKKQAMDDADLLEQLGTARDKIDTTGTVSVHYIDITPKMKESVVTRGQPLFSVGAGAGGAGAAATQQEEKK